MSLVPCYECGEQVSTDAASCPKCGAPLTTAATPRNNPQPPKAASSPVIKGAESVFGLKLLVGFGVILIVTLGFQQCCSSRMPRLAIKALRPLRLRGHLNPRRRGILALARMSQTPSCRRYQSPVQRPPLSGSAGARGQHGRDNAHAHPKKGRGEWHDWRRCFTLSTVTERGHTAPAREPSQKKSSP